MPAKWHKRFVVPRSALQFDLVCAEFVQKFVGLQSAGKIRLCSKLQIKLLAFVFFLVHEAVVNTER